jgi:hypothetical protein
MADNPIGYWLFDTAGGISTLIPDWSGNGYDLTRTAGGTATVVGGVMVDGSSRGAVNIGGSASWVDTSDVVALAFVGNVPYSIEYWINLDTGGAIQNVVNRRETTGPNGWSAFINASDQPGFNRANGSTTEGFAAPTVLSTGVAYHIVFTYDGTNGRIYINGVLDAGPTSLSNALTDRGNGMQIALGVGATSPLDGTLDELAFYDRVLTAVEIAHHYQVGTQGL